MRNIGFLFPGQASQYVGMAKDLFEQFPVAREYFEKADAIMGYNLHKIVFSGPEEKLRQTNITQPAVFVHSAILTELLKERGIIPSIAAGHSLGEYSAVVCSEALSFEDGLRLVKLRGELMHKADVKSPGTMAAIIGLDRETVEKICNEVNSNEVLMLANYNSPKQFVISGSIRGVEAGMNLASEYGAKRVVKLNVGGAFHSSLMEYAKKGLSEAIDNCKFNEPRIPVVSNFTAKPCKNANEIKNNLKKQLLNPVKWEDSMRIMISDGVNYFLEVGPKRVLQGLMKQIDRNIEIYGVDKKEDLNKI